MSIEHVTVGNNPSRMHGMLWRTVADAAALAALAITADDVAQGKPILQADTRQLWLPISTSPTFSRILTPVDTKIGRTLFVDCSYTGDVEDGALSTPYKTIQAAINAVPVLASATAYYTEIRVSPGRYAEALTVLGDRAIALRSSSMAFPSTVPQGVLNLTSLNYNVTAATDFALLSLEGFTFSGAITLTRTSGGPAFPTISLCRVSCSGISESGSFSGIVSLDDVNGGTISVPTSIYLNRDAAQLETKTTNFNIVTNQHYAIGTIAGNIVATLPASPKNGEWTRLNAGPLGGNTVTIARNGNTINGAAADLVVSAGGAYANAYLIFDSTQNTWVRFGS